jgi:lipopolysaccharide/colanic/teichoic acid biosynthesis glycosyltransferase
MLEEISRHRMDSASCVLTDYASLPPLGGPWKRAIDVAMAAVALVVLMPLILATAALIRFLTQESILLSERLIGRGGRTFVGYRFRLPAAPAQGTSQYLECVAAAVSRSSLDKLPQFINVMRGDMSLIGPRPRAAAEFGDYLARAPECQLARPGLISIGETYGAALGEPRTEIALERYYVSHWSMGLDFVLLGKAIFCNHHRDWTA